MGTVVENELEPLLTVLGDEDLEIFAGALIPPVDRGSVLIEEAEVVDVVAIDLSVGEEVVPNPQRWGVVGLVARRIVGLQPDLQEPELLLAELAEELEVLCGIAVGHATAPDTHLRALV